MAKKLTEQQKELKLLEQVFKSAQHRFSFSKSARNFKTIGAIFGASLPDSPMVFKDIEFIKQLIEQTIKQKYESRRYITERTVSSTALSTKSGEYQQIDDETKAELELCEGTDKREQQAHSEAKESTWVSKYPNQKAVLMIKHCNQQKCAKELWDCFANDGQVGQMLIAATGSGKTFIAGSFIKNFVEQGFIEKLGCISPYPIVYITANPIVEQTEKVFRRKFGLNIVTQVHVVNIEVWRSKFGENFVRETIEHHQGKEKVVYKWNPYMHPCLFFYDECQMVAIETSKQHRIALAGTEIWDHYSTPVIHVFMSATPYARPCEAKVFACSTRAEFEFGLQKVRINSESWPTFVNTITDNPYEYNTAAVKRFRAFFDKYTRTITGIKPKFKAFNSVKPMQFRDRMEAEEYNRALEKFFEKKAKIEASDMSGSQMNMCILGQLIIFAKAAEKIKCPHYAKWADEVWKAGKSPVLIVNYKQTITHTVKILINDYNWTREDISLIWGGSTETLSAKQKMAKKVKEAGLDEKFKEMGINPEDLGLDLDVDFKERTEEEYNFEKENRLLSNDAEIERTLFQEGKSRACLMTFAKGGVGLSVHHEGDEEYKPIYPESRPREVMMGTIWSEKKLIQGTGRAPRITSASHTYQTMGYYVGTIEEKIMRRVVQKMKCMKEVVRAREHWEDIITGRPMEIEEENAIEVEHGIEQEYVEA